jgi:AmmeMemoRadiSam system protein A
MHTEANESTLSAEVRRFLIDLARTTIRSRLDGRALPSHEPEHEVLLDRRGAFVTLKIEGRLRGCIGHVVGVAPLWVAVRDNAIAAAFQDPRFAPLEAEELPKTRIEISALTPLRRVAAEDVVVGRDGILIESGLARGLLLPQVPVEYGWDWETFLDQTCRKAGLGPGCWRSPETALSAFSAEVFGEEEL